MSHQAWFFVPPITCIPSYQISCFKANFSLWRPRLSRHIVFLRICKMLSLKGKTTHMRTPVGCNYWHALGARHWGSRLLFCPVAPSLDLDSWLCRSPVGRTLAIFRSITYLGRPRENLLLPSKVYLYNRTFRSSAASLIFYPHAHTRHESLQIEMLHAWDGTRYSSFHPILYEHLWIRYRKQGVERRISHVVKMSSLASLLSANTFQNLSGVVVSKQRLRTGMKTQFFNPNV